jgi:hypothetical protein
MNILGVDVGIHSSHYAVAEGYRVIHTGILAIDGDILRRFNIGFAGIDAPLSLPSKGTLRECEKILLKRGIRLFPSGAEFFRKVAERGMEIAEWLREEGVEVYEVYPYATRKILGISPLSKKNSKAGIKKIKDDLGTFLEFDNLENSDTVDAAISALTIRLFLEGKGMLLKGKDGEIVIPLKE